MSTDLLRRQTMRTIVKATTAHNLAECTQDVISWQDRGALADGPLRALGARFVAETGEARGLMLTIQGAIEALPIE